MKLSHNLRVLTFFTVAELLRRKILHILFFLFAIFCFSLSLWKHFAPETEMQFLIDLGIGLLGLFLLVATVVIGSDMIPNDIQRRRLLFFYTHPIGKPVYLLGRWLGTVFVLLVAFTILIAALKIFFLIQHWPIAVSPSIFLFLKYLVLISFLFWFSTFTERFSAVFLGLSFYFFSNSFTTLSFLASESQKPALAFWVKVLGLILPHFEFFDAGGSLPSLWHKAPLLLFLKLSVYAGGFSLLYLFFAYLVLRRKTI